METVTHRRDLWKVITVPGNSAEIGVAEGYFSNDILSWRCSFPTHYLVDRWACRRDVKGDSGNPQEWHDKNYAAAMARVSPHGRRAVSLRGESHKMSVYVDDDSLAFLYIDGDHSFEGVMTDILSWLPKVKVGGIVAFHDYLAPQYGVKRAVDTFCLRYKKTLIVMPEDKPEDAGAYFIN